MNRQERNCMSDRGGRGQGRCRGGLGQGHGCRGRQAEQGAEAAGRGLGRGQGLDSAGRGMGRGRRDGSCRVGAPQGNSGVDTGSSQE